MISPGIKNIERISCDGLIKDSPVTTDHLTHTNHIYGPEVLDLKGKGTKQKIPSIPIDILKVLPSIISLYHNVTTCGDVFFFNKVELFSSISLNIRYGYGEHLLNRQIPTFLKTIKHMRSCHALRGFLLRVIKLNP